MEGIIRFLTVYRKSSVLRFSPPGSVLPMPANVVTPTYNNGSNEVPVPFTFNKQTGIIDIDFTTGFTSGTEINNNNTLYIRSPSYSALSLVRGIGSNIKAWFENSNYADAVVGSVTMFKAPIIIPANAQMVDLEPNSINSFEYNLFETPVFESSGTVANNFYGTYLFREPLVIRYIVKNTESIRYAIFNTQFEGNT